MKESIYTICSRIMRNKIIREYRTSCNKCPASNKRRLLMYSFIIQMLAQLITLANKDKIISNSKHIQEQLQRDVPEKQLPHCEFYSLEKTHRFTLRSKNCHLLISAAYEDKKIIRKMFLF